MAVSDQLSSFSFIPLNSVYTWFLALPLLLGVTDTWKAGNLIHSTLTTEPRRMTPRSPADKEKAKSAKLIHVGKSVSK